MSFTEHLFEDAAKYLQEVFMIVKFFQLTSLGTLWLMLYCFDFFTETVYQNIN